MKDLWFTGNEWNDGTAENILCMQYQLACRREREIEAQKSPEQKASDKRKRDKRRFQKWFTYSLRKEAL